MARGLLKEFGGVFQADTGKGFPTQHPGQFGNPVFWPQFPDLGNGPVIFGFLADLQVIISQSGYLRPVGNTNDLVPAG